MPFASNSILALILIALGCLAIILSFLVPDRKKSLIALAMGGVIVFVGVLSYFVPKAGEWNRRRQIRQARPINPADMEKMKAEFEKRAAETKAAATSKKAQ